AMRRDRVGLAREAVIRSSRNLARFGVQGQTGGQRGRNRESLRSARESGHRNGGNGRFFHKGVGGLGIGKSYNRRDTLRLRLVFQTGPIGRAYHIGKAHFVVRGGKRRVAPQSRPNKGVLTIQNANLR